MWQEQEMETERRRGRRSLFILGMYAKKKKKKNLLPVWDPKEICVCALVVLTTI